MTMNKTMEGDQLTILLEGRLDTTTAPQLEEELKASVAGVKKLVMDFEKLDYLSSAGLRVLLSMAKKHPNHVTLSGANETVREIIEQTGFDSVLHVE